MLSSISSSISGIKAAFGMLGVSARNTALMDADGYKKETVRLTEGKNGGVVVTLGRDYSPGGMYQSNGRLVEASNVNYIDEAANRISARFLLKANVAAYKTAQRMEEALLDIKA